jgi:hypothetical protein
MKLVSSKTTMTTDRMIGAIGCTICVASIKEPCQIT